MDLLQVNGPQIVDSQGHPLRLRGTCVGGWMNLENFINGYPGTEHGLRSSLAVALGAARAEFFCERLLDHFLAEPDIAFIRAAGSNVVRLALNYRHFESDAEPFVYREAGFRRLDQAVQWCAAHGLYVILDLHAAPGWQNPDWHSDNNLNETLLWQQRQFQDRCVALWQELARRYAGNPTIAGYDLINEPMTAGLDGRLQSEALNALYRRLVAAIRATDPDHIIFLEGDAFGSRFCGLEPPFADNLVYSGHAYCPAGSGPGQYPGWLNGKYWNREYQVGSFWRHEAPQFARQHNVPLWMGEFGSVYNGPAAEVPSRLAALDDQIDVFEEFGAHWTTWTYKDVGAMGWLVVDPAAEYMQIIAPVLSMKAQLRTDAWLSWLPATPAGNLARDLAAAIDEVICDPAADQGWHAHLVAHAALHGHAAALLQPIFARRFQGLDEAGLDRVLAAFTLANCRPNTGLLDIIRKHTARPA